MRFRLLAIAGLLAAASGCEPTAPPGPSYPAEQTYATSLGIDLSTFVKVDTNLYYKDIVVGTGATAAEFKTITAHYAGYLVDGSTFDSGDFTRQLTTGQNGLITGWVLGVPGMKVGGKRRLVIGSNYAYGSSTQGGSLPAFATLVFDIELKGVQ